MLSRFNPFNFINRLFPVKDGGMSGSGYFYQYLNNHSTALNITNTQKLIIEGYVKNPHVCAVINAIVRPTMSIPWYVYEEKDSVARKRYEAAMKSGNHEEALLQFHKSVDYYEGTEIPLTRLLNQPNPLQTFNELVADWLYQRLLNGESGLYKFKNSLSDNTREIWNLPMYAMLNDCDSTWYNKVTKWYMVINGQVVATFSPDELIHTKLYNPLLDPNGLAPRGLSPLTALHQVIPTSNKGFTAQLRLVENGGPVGILSNGSNELMMQNQKEDAQQMFDKNYSGEYNRGKIHLTTANLKYVSLGLNSTDLKLLESRGADLADVCNVFGSPKEIMSDQSGSSFNNKKEAEKKLWNDAILPHLDVFREIFNNQLAPKNSRGRRIFIDYDHHAVPALQQDMEKIWKRVSEAIEHHMITPAMANEIMGYDNNDTSNPRLNEYMLRTNLRWSDEALPGQTGMDNNGNNNDTTGSGGNP